MKFKFPGGRENKKKSVKIIWIFAIIGVLAVVFVGVLWYGFYNKNWQSQYLEKIMITLPTPVARVNKSFIYLY